MSVRFIIGRAGTGKTYHCLREIRTRLARDAVLGPRLVLLVPEQAALQMERTLIDGTRVRAAHRLEVLSFRRLAWRILSATGDVRASLSESARTMVLRHLLSRLRTQLQYYRRADRQTGLASHLGRTISELIQESIAPEEIVEPIEGAAADRPPVQAAKLHDLALLYRAYLDFLGTDHVDSSQYQALARARLGRTTFLDEAEVWVDGFASLSREESLTLVELAKRSRHVDITALVDPRVGSNTPHPADLFRKTRQTWLALSRMIAGAGVAIDEPLALSPEVPPRFQAESALARIEVAWKDALFELNEADAEMGGECSVQIGRAPSLRVEIEFAVAQVMRWVRETGYRYRDVAIITRDLEPYHDLIAAALDARNIPYFIDRRRPIAHHPLTELLRGAVSLIADDYSGEAVRLLLKTGLLPLATDACDQLENHLLATGIAGYRNWADEDWAYIRRRTLLDEAPDDAQAGNQPLVAINEFRKEFLACFSAWFESARSQPARTGSAWADALRALLANLEMEAQLTRWAESAENLGRLGTAAEHRQILRDVDEFLGDLGYGLAAQALNAHELRDVLEAGLASLTLGLAPPMVDQVLVGSIERSRHPEIQAAVLLGFQDGTFPRRHQEDPILNDDDRNSLRARDVGVGLPARQRNLDEALLAYVAVTRPSRELVITYAESDPDGKALLPSPFLTKIRSALPDVAESSIDDPVRARESWDVQTVANLATRMVAEFRDRPALADDAGIQRSRWNALYEASRHMLVNGASAERALRELAGPLPAMLPSGRVSAFYPDPLRTSISRLESFATCPFQHFSRYMLNLEERRTAEVGVLDVGMIHHAVLENFINDMVASGRALGDLDDAGLLAQLQKSCDDLGVRLPDDALSGSSRDAYLLKRSARHLARILRGQRRAAGAGDARPRRAELPFGFEDRNGLPALKLETPRGRHVALRGYIDRVDLAELAGETLGIVVDYKRSKDRLSLAQVYHGLSLQLLGYLIVLAEHGASLAGRPIQPLAAFYISGKPKRETAKHPALVKDGRDETGAARPRGILLADRFGALDSNLTDSGWSRYYSYYRKSDGAVGQIDRSDAADKQSFGNILDHTKKKIGELADAVLDGDVSVRPYRLGTFSPCAWCAMASVCRFEMGTHEVRFLDELKRSDVFRRLAGD